MTRMLYCAECGHEEARGDGGITPIPDRRGIIVCPVCEAPAAAVWPDVEALEQRGVPLAALEDIVGQECFKFCHRCDEYKAGAESTCDECGEDIVFWTPLAICQFKWVLQGDIDRLHTLQMGVCEGDDRHITIYRRNERRFSDICERCNSYMAEDGGTCYAEDATRSLVLEFLLDTSVIMCSVCLACIKPPSSPGEPLLQHIPCNCYVTVVGCEAILSNLRDVITGHLQARYAYTHHSNCVAVLSAIKQEYTSRLSPQAITGNTVNAAEEIDTNCSRNIRPAEYGELLHIHSPAPRSPEVPILYDLPCFVSDCFLEGCECSGVLWPRHDYIKLATAVTSDDEDAAVRAGRPIHLPQLLSYCTNCGGSVATNDSFTEPECVACGERTYWWTQAALQSYLMAWYVAPPPGQGGDILKLTCSSHSAVIFDASELYGSTCPVCLDMLGVPGSSPIAEVLGDVRRHYCANCMEFPITYINGRQRCCGTCGEFITQTVTYRELNYPVTGGGLPPVGVVTRRLLDATPEAANISDVLHDVAGTRWPVLHGAPSESPNPFFAMSDAAAAADLAERAQATIARAAEGQPAIGPYGFARPVAEGPCCHVGINYVSQDGYHKPTTRDMALLAHRSLLDIGYVNYVEGDYRGVVSVWEAELVLTAGRIAPPGAEDTYSVLRPLSLMAWGLCNSIGITQFHLHTHRNTGRIEKVSYCLQAANSAGAIKVVLIFDDGAMCRNSGFTDRDLLGVILGDTVDPEGTADTGWTTVVAPPATRERDIQL